jgi:putative aldouronate transport system permease protein
MASKQINTSNTTYNSTQLKQNKKQKIIASIKRDRFLYLMAFPGILYFIVFKYVPMWGLAISFKNYSPYLGFWKSEFVGLEHFRRFFSNESFFILLRNTLSISFLSLMLYFPAPIILALLLNEVTNTRFKRVIQTAVYFPHFLSWVIISGITYIMLGQTSGVINQFLSSFGMEKIPFLSSTKLFYPMLIFQNIWKDAGWGTVIFLAAITGLDPGTYESAKIDGANRLKQIWYITLPGIKNVIIILLILRIGRIMDTGFEQIYLMTNASVASIADVFDTYVYRNGVRMGQFSFSAAVGLFKSVIGLALVVTANKIAKSFGEEGVY